jgi:hypothetical protein
MSAPLSEQSFFAVYSLVWIIAHAGLYVFFLKRKAAMKTERGVFFWHFGSFVVVCLAGLALVICRPGNESIAVLVFAGALHGVYSLSFLELWSLSEGGFSLRLLAEIANGADSPEVLAERSGATIGKNKLALRIESLRNLGLLMPNEMSLTPIGRAAALMLGFILSLSDGKSLNQ